MVSHCVFPLRRLPLHHRCLLPNTCANNINTIVAADLFFFAPSLAPLPSLPFSSLCHLFVSINDVNSFNRFIHFPVLFSTWWITHIVVGKIEPNQSFDWDSIRIREYIHWVFTYVSGEAFVTTSLGYFSLSMCYCLLCCVCGWENGISLCLFSRARWKSI